MLKCHALHHLVFDYLNSSNLVQMLERLYRTITIFFGEYRLVRAEVDNSLTKMD